MIESIFRALGAGLNLWTHKDKNKYLDKLHKTKKAFYEEYNKSMPDDAVLDYLEFELCVLADSFAAQAGTPNTSDK